MLKKGDIIIAIFVLAIAAAGFGYNAIRTSGSGTGKVAVIKKDGVRIKRINLDNVGSSQVFTVKGAFSDVIEVEKGRIRFKAADCPNRDCVETGWIEKRGALAVCLPNKVIIKIEGFNNEIDGGTY